MIWIDADRPAWRKGGVPERARFEARCYAEAQRLAEAWGATRVAYENGKVFERADGEWVRIDR